MVLTVVATAAGSAAVIAYQPSLQRRAEAIQLAEAAAAGGGSAAAGNLVVDDGADDGKQAAKGKKKAAQESSPTWFNGAQVDTAAGIVQVRVQLDEGQIRDVQVLIGPHMTRHSVWLSRQATELLRAEVVQAQSADVDMITGATYTSTGYLQSLQAALDAAEGS